jgi:hypothetical protein
LGSANKQISTCQQLFFQKNTLTLSYDASGHDRLLQTTKLNRGRVKNKIIQNIQAQIILDD